MEYIILQLTVPETRQLIRQELESFFAAHKSFLQKPEEDMILNVKEAAQFLGLSVPTIYSLVSKSVLPYAKRTKRLYFYKTDLNNFIKAGRNRSILEINSDADNSLIHKKASNGR